MRPRFLIKLGVALVIVIGFLLLLRKKQESAALPPVVNSQSQPSRKIETNNSPQPAKAMQVTTATHVAGVPDAVLEYVQKIKADPQYDWKQPINFYGRVVDESNESVAGASIHFIWNDISPTGTSEADVKSDDNGFFSLTDRKGKAMTVAVGKDGYYGMNQSFEFANPAEGGFYVPDRNNPVVFHLRKKGVGVDLVSSLRGAGINSDLHLVPPTNGLPVFVDFFNRQIGDSGQLKIEGWKELKDFKTAENNWGFRITVPDGGLIEENDEFPFEAPDADYQSVMEWHFTDGDPGWKGYLKKSFYIKFGNPPRYGIISVETTAFAPGVYLRYIFNPDGSRNLEPK